MEHIAYRCWIVFWINGNGWTDTAATRCRYSNGTEIDSTQAYEFGRQKWIFCGELLIESNTYLALVLLDSFANGQACVVAQPCLRPQCHSLSVTFSRRSATHRWMISQFPVPGSLIPLRKRLWNFPIPSPPKFPMWRWNLLGWLLWPSWLGCCILFQGNATGKRTNDLANYFHRKMMKLGYSFVVVVVLAQILFLSQQYFSVIRTKL